MPTCSGVEAVVPSFNLQYGYLPGYLPRLRYPLELLVSSNLSGLLMNCKQYLSTVIVLFPGFSDGSSNSSVLTRSKAQRIVGNSNRFGTGLAGLDQSREIAGNIQGGVRTKTAMHYFDEFPTWRNFVVMRAVFRVRLIIVCTTFAGLFSATILDLESSGIVK